MENNKITLPIMKRFFHYLLSLTCLSFIAAEDTFKPYATEEEVPRNVTDLWKNYDPSLEALDTEIVKVWKEEGVICKYVIFTVGTFKGVPSRIAAFYTYPEGGSNLPAFVWAHGGGQNADKKRGYHYAKKGYATVDINWGGREITEGITQNTNWGKVDPSQGKKFYSQSKRGWKVTLSPDDYTIDHLTSPRNSNWFILALAGRRAITFLEKQPEVNPDKLGFTGFSMGGNITNMSAIDKRLKAAIPMVGGSAYRLQDYLGHPGSGSKLFKPVDLHKPTIEGQYYWEKVQCPVMFFSSTNDFHGLFDRYIQCAEVLPHNNWRITQTMHNDHNPRAKQFLAAEYWFNHYLKGEPLAIPKTATSSLKKIENSDEVIFTVSPDQIDKIKEVKVYYSYNSFPNLRFNRHSPSTRQGDNWSTTIKKRKGLPLYVFADITYQSLSAKSEATVKGETDTFSIISQQQVLLPQQLDMTQLDDANRTFNPIFESFDDNLADWGKQKSKHSLSFLTYKFNALDLLFPVHKKLSLKVHNPEGRKLRVYLDVSSAKHLDREKNQGKRLRASQDIAHNESIEYHFSLADFKTIEKKDTEKTSPLTSWHNISTFTLFLKDLKTGKDLDLTLPENTGYIELIHWTE